MGPVGAALARDVSPVALEDVAVAGNGEADRALYDLPQPSLHGDLPRGRLLQLALQVVQLGFLGVQGVLQGVQLGFLGFQGIQLGFLGIRLGFLFLRHVDKKCVVTMTGDDGTCGSGN